jgi:hypothetical protein
MAQTQAQTQAQDESSLLKRKTPSNDQEIVFGKKLKVSSSLASASELLPSPPSATPSAVTGPVTGPVTSPIAATVLKKEPNDGGKEMKVVPKKEIKANDDGKEVNAKAPASNKEDIIGWIYFCRSEDEDVFSVIQQGANNDIEAAFRRFVAQPHQNQSDMICFTLMIVDQQISIAFPGRKCPVGREEKDCLVTAVGLFKDEGATVQCTAHGWVSEHPVKRINGIFKFDLGGHFANPHIGQTLEVEIDQDGRNLCAYYQYGNKVTELLEVFYGRPLLRCQTLPLPLQTPPKEEDDELDQVRDTILKMKHQSSADSSSSTPEQQQQLIVRQSSSIIKKEDDLPILCLSQSDEDEMKYLPEDRLLSELLITTAPPWYCAIGHWLKREAFIGTHKWASWHERITEFAVKCSSFTKSKSWTLKEYVTACIVFFVTYNQQSHYSSFEAQTLTSSVAHRQTTADSWCVAYVADSITEIEKSSGVVTAAISLLDKLWFTGQQIAVAKTILVSIKLMSNCGIPSSTTKGNSRVHSLPIIVREATTVLHHLSNDLLEFVDLVSNNFPNEKWKINLLIKKVKELEKPNNLLLSSSSSSSSSFSASSSFSSSSSSSSSS